MIKTIKFLFKLSIVLGILALMGVGGIFAYYAKDLPSPASIQELKIIESTKIYDRTGEILLYDIHGEQKRTIIAFADISSYIKHATIVAEDDEFYKHFGIDLKGIARAAISNIKGQTVLQGGSTITQQLIKNTYLTPERTLSRKIKEIILAIELELKYTKDNILSFYLNVVPYGSNAYGIEAASQTFFNKRALDLTLAEATLLASLPKAPTYYSPFGNNPEKLELRQKYILDRMYNLGYISEKKYLEAKKEEIIYAGEDTGIKAPHFVMYIREYLEKNYGEDVLKSSGLKITTTLNWELQKEAERLVKDWAEVNEKRFGAKNAALVAIDPKTGQLLAMVGSRDYFDKGNDGNVNVTTRLRQPGSSFKPFVYAKAFDKGYTHDTILFDVETNFGVQGAEEYIPGNYDELFRGPITFKEALAQSINVPAVKVLYLAGVKDTIALAKDMGITSLNDPSRYGLSLVLGGGEVKLLDETAAYGVFSQEGVYNEPTGIISIASKRGEVLEQFRDKSKRVLNTQTARIITSILSSNELRAPTFGTKSYLYIENIPSAVKTGTTQEYRDAWTVGYTTDLVVGVWAGNNDNSTMDDAAGVKAAAPIWNEFMQEAYQILSLTPKDFNEPSPVQTDKPILNGSLGGSVKVRVDKITGKLATEFTPEELVEERLFYAPHSLLYFVAKDDPQGPEPKENSRDSQFSLWEEAIQNWVDSTTTQENYRFDFDPVPQEYDEVHTKQTTPTVLVRFPTEGRSFGKNESILLSLRLGYVFPIEKIEIFFDDKIIRTISNPTIGGQTTGGSIQSGENLYNLYSGNFSTFIKAPSSISNKNPHTIRVKIFDKFLNRKQTTVSIDIE